MPRSRRGVGRGIEKDACGRGVDGGSGAIQPVSRKMIASVKKAIDCPLIVGGGMNTVSKALDALQAGADVIVVGNGIEENPNLLIEISEKVHEMNGMLRA